VRRAPVWLLPPIAVALVTTMALGACGTKNRPTLAQGHPAIGRARVSTTTTPTTCKALGTGVSLIATAAVKGPLAIYAEPDEPAPSTTMVNPLLYNNDPASPVPLTYLVKDFPVSEHCAWLQVYLPVRPNGSTGWVRVSDVVLTPNPYRLEADLAEFQLKVFKDGQATDTIRIGVAENNTPTPGGIYYLTELIRPPDPNGDYGPYAYGLSGFSDALTSFNGGPGQLGIHGTDEPQLIGTQVSHGCIRMNNADITKLAQFLPLGTPVQIDA
jgi:lipoprotein-anchoring transpeptidase ErfK/SrfK